MLDEYGWSAPVAARVAEVATPETYPGRVIRIDRGSYLVAVEQGTVDAAAVNELTAGVAVGDWVVVRGDETTGRMITAIAPRRSALVRRDPSPSDNRDQVLAANIDIALILYRLDRKLRMAVIERYLVLVLGSGATPAIVLSKSDLIDPEAMNRVVREVRRSAPEVPVVAVSARTGGGLGELSALFRPGQTVALLGESGAGKSTLVNQIIGTEMLATGATRARDGRGRHTTTAREMVPLGDGTVFIDTPGLRSVGLADTHEGVERVFADVEELAGYCRFRDCAHQGEPGCAIESAVEHGVLDRRRLVSYLKLVQEQERVAKRNAEVAKRAAGRSRRRRG